MYDKIESYLNGELKAEELSDFEQALQSDEALAKSVEQYREMIRRLDAARLRTKVKAAMVQPGFALEKRSRMVFRRLFWSVAAALMLLAAAVWFMNRPPAEPSKDVAENQPVITRPGPLPPVEQEPAVSNPREAQPARPAEKPPENRARRLALAREFYIPPSSGFLRDAARQTDESRPKDPIQLAAEAFENKDYRLVLDHLELMVIAEQDEEALFLRANAYLQLGQFAAAARNFGELNRSFQFRHEARWSLLLCQIALGKNESAKALLAEMVVDTDFPFHSQALELQGKLNF